ncbi:hypothetical protein EDD85DRAFT_956977 [Armillaria nabsnona]|nr:hypothetical protein EDD85DRAFT_956977 [Armillaria nabsnona]
MSALQMNINIDNHFSSHFVFFNLKAFFDAPEVVQLVLDTFDCQSLIAISHTNSFFHDHIRSLIGHRLQCALTDFIPEELLLQFFTLLDFTGAAIGGSVALKSLTLSCEWKPSDLNIIIPCYRTDKWATFFHTYGCHAFVPPPESKYTTSRMFARHIDSLWSWEKAGASSSPHELSTNCRLRKEQSLSQRVRTFLCFRLFLVRVQQAK